MLQYNRFKGIIHCIERFGGFAVDGSGYGNGNDDGDDGG